MSNQHRKRTDEAVEEPNAEPATPEHSATKLVLIPAVLVAASAFGLFALRMPLIGYPLLGAGLVLAVILDRRFAIDLGLIGLGIAIVSTTSVEADVSWPSFIRIGTVLALAVTAPFLVDRLILKRKAYGFPWRSRQKKTKVEIAYIFLVPFLGWAILPFYFIRSTAYENWPHITDAGELARFFVGVNAVGTWDELFFICTCFALLRRHFPVWQANLLQMVIFTSFLWELGYREWGPLLTVPFALLQGWLFSRTRSLGYVLIVHLLFDAIVFMAIIHAHNRDWIPIFIY
jgi:membrane protease YdiL (CAAX protease family)